jgi:ubiquinone biosynthesis monooxygenase Coq7
VSEAVEPTGIMPGAATDRQSLERMIRVDHAGEYGAKHIYAGQLAILGRSRHADAVGDTLRHMQAQEQHHLDTFSSLIIERRVRPTALLPIWRIAGFTLGALTAAMGPRAAMACTVAVEETIDAHYAAQEAALDDGETALRETIGTFRAEELEHRDIGIAHDAEQAPFYRLMSAAIKTGCKAAIRISEIV